MASESLRASVDGVRQGAVIDMAKRFEKPTDGYVPNAPQEVLNRSVEEFNLYDETVNKLKSVELNTVGDVASVEMRQLYRIEKMNKRDVFAVLRMLKSVKLDFRQVPKAENSGETKPQKENARRDQNKNNGNKIQPKTGESDKAGDNREQRENAPDRSKNKRGKRNDNRDTASNADRSASDKVKSVPITLEREKVNTRDYDSHGNKRRDRDRDNNRDNKDSRDSSRNKRDKKPTVVNLPPLKIEDGLYKFYKGGKWGYKDESGKVVIEPLYDEAYNFSEGLAGVEIGEKVGFINTSGEMVIPAIYDSVTSFKEGLASVTLNDKCAYIDKEGNEVFGFDYEAATCFTNNIALVKKDGKWGYMDRFTGEIRLR